MRQNEHEKAEKTRGYPHQGRSSVLGTPVVRLDARAKATGRHRYMSDLDIPGALWAVLVRSPHPHARVRSIDFTRALALEGVVAAFGPSDVPAIQFNTAFLPIDIPLRPSMETLVDKRLLALTAQHVGDAVGVIVATEKRVAKLAASQVDVDWEIFPPILDPEEALKHGEIVARISSGNETANDLWETCEIVVTGSYWTPAIQHISMETHGCAAQMDPVNGRLTIWSNTQSPFLIRRLCSNILGLPISRVRILKVDEGGGFGGKQELHEEALIGWLAQRLGRPVRLQLTRAEEFSAGRSRHAARVNIRLGFRRDGHLLVSDMDVLLDSGAYTSHVMTVLRNLSETVRTSYPAATHCFTGTAVRTNTLPGGAYRGYGAPQANFALEQAMDTAARKLGIDPLEIRLRNAISPEGNEIVPLIACLQRGSHIFGWPGSQQQIVGEDEIVRASGIALAGLTSGTFPARLEASAATVRWNEDGTATLITGTCDSSTGSSTALAQIVAEELAIPVTAVDVLEGDTDLGVLDMGSFAQRTITIGGEAARQAAVAAREALFQAVATEHHLSPTDLMIREGSIYDKTGWSLALEDFCRLYTARGGGMLATTTYRPMSNTPSFGVCFVQVAVDLRTGKVIVERCVSVADCGRVLNPLGATGQVLGGTVQGLGGALIDLYHKTPEGAGPQCIRDHGVPGVLDIGHIAAILPDLPDGAGPYGAKGLGEVSIVPVAAAIANAVARATNATPCRLPMRPSVVWLTSHVQK